MRKILLLLMLLPFLAVKTSALEITPPSVPASGADWMPNDTGSFSDGFSELLHKALGALLPEVRSAVQTATTLTAIALLFSILHSFHGSSRRIANIAGSLTVASILLKNTDALIRLGTATIVELSEYGKLLLPVMTAALASQGGAVTSATLYAGTAAFDLLLTSLISHILVPAVYGFLALSIANSALGEHVLERFRDFLKWFISWTLKTLLTIFTTYISISGVVSGTTDAVTLKATKFTISSVIPVVGGILSDASEAVLVSAALVKNAAGIYGILAILAVFLAPFLKICVQFLILKLTAALCSLYGTDSITKLIDHFSVAMGLLLAMTGSVCLLLLISTICFLKGVG